MVELVIFILGLCVGSFLNVLIDRLPRGKSIVRGRSHCDSCRKTLRWYDLIPIVSFLLLAGRCRYCHSPIPPRNLLVEVLTALSFVAVYRTLPSNSISLFEYFFWVWVAGAFIVIFFVDLKHSIIPDAVVFPTLVLAILRIINISVITHRVEFSLLVSAIVGSLLFFLLHVGTKGKGMGFGDVKLVLLIGLILGHPRLWVALYAAFLTGAGVGVILVLGRRLKLKQTIAFGPFLIIGTVVALLFGENIYRWWIRFIL